MLETTSADHVCLRSKSTFEKTSACGQNRHPKHYTSAAHVCVQNRRSKPRLQPRQLHFLRISSFYRSCAAHSTVKMSHLNAVIMHICLNIGCFYSVAHFTYNVKTCQERQANSAPLLAFRDGLWDNGITGCLKTSLSRTEPLCFLPTRRTLCQRLKTSLPQIKLCASLPRGISTLFIRKPTIP